MEDIESKILQYEKVRGGVVEAEQKFTRELMKDVGDELFFQGMGHTTERSYPHVETYLTYRRLVENGEQPSYLCMEDVNFLVMDKAISLKPDGKISRDDYLAISSEAYSEVGLEKMKTLLGIDDFGMERGDVFKKIRLEEIKPHVNDVSLKHFQEIVDKDLQLVLKHHNRLYEAVASYSTSNNK